MMDDILTFCDKTLENIKQEIANFKKNLKPSIKKESLNEMEKTIKNNAETAEIVSDSNGIRDDNYLFHKLTLNHLSSWVK